jgi:hypothetical protein
MRKREDHGDQSQCFPDNVGVNRQRCRDRFAVRAALQPDPISLELDAACATWNTGRDPRARRRGTRDDGDPLFSDINQKPRKRVNAYGAMI